ncbi:MAG: TrkA C-terminal domain-containing protein, partial [Limisphaerales bacterium]
RTLTPSGADRIQAGDELLVLGTPRQIHDLREWLNPLDDTALPAESTLPPK